MREVVANKGTDKVPLFFHVNFTKKAGPALLCGALSRIHDTVLFPSPSLACRDCCPCLLNQYASLVFNVPPEVVPGGHACP